MFEQKFVTVGKVRMTQQAFIICMLGVVLTLILTIRGLMTVSKPSTAIATIAIALVILAFFLYAAYAVNCMVVGKCAVLSWAITIFYVVYMTVAIVALGIMGIGKSTTSAAIRDHYTPKRK